MYSMHAIGWLWHGISPIISLLHMHTHTHSNFECKTMYSFTLTWAYLILWLLFLLANQPPLYELLCSVYHCIWCTCIQIVVGLLRNGLVCALDAVSRTITAISHHSPSQWPFITRSNYTHCELTRNGLYTDSWLTVPELIYSSFFPAWCGGALPER